MLVIAGETIVDMIEGTMLGSSAPLPVAGPTMSRGRRQGWECRRAI